MKNFLFLSIGIMLGVNGYAQESSNPWKFGLTSRFRYEDSQFYDLSDHKQFSHIRIRPIVTYDSSNGTKVVLEPQYTKIMGLSVAGSSTGSPTETSGNTSYTGSLDTLWIRQGYMDVKLAENINMIMGRQALSYGDQVIIGPSDWGVYGRAFDAFRLRWEDGSSSVDIFQAKISEVSSSSQADGSDKDLSGIHATLSPHENVKAWDLYYFYLADNRRAGTANGNISADTTRPNYFGAYGTRIVTSFGNWDWKIEYAKNFGDKNTPYMGDDSKNDMLDTTVAVSLGETQKHKVGLQLFTAGENWRELYPTTHTALGRNDVLGRRNLTGVGLSHSTKWSDLWSSDATVYMFQRTSSDSTAFSTNSSTAVGSAATTNTSKEVGNELDLNVKYQLQKETSLSLGLAFFQTGAYLKDSLVDDRKPTFGYFMVESKF